MKRFLVTGVITAFSVLVIAACSNSANNPLAPAPVTVQAATPKNALRAFKHLVVSLVRIDDPLQTGSKP